MRTLPAIGILALSCKVFSVQAGGTTDVVCSYAPSQNENIRIIGEAFGNTNNAVEAIRKAASLTPVRHSSGAYIFTGSGGYVTGTLGRAAASPFLMNVNILLVGGSLTLELACAPKNHPESIRTIQRYADLFIGEATVVMNGPRLQVASTVRKLNDSAIDVRDGTLKRAWAANRVAIEYRDNTLRYIRW